MTTIRPATTADVEALLQLRALMFGEIDRAADDTWQGACRQSLLDGITAGDLVAVVAEAGDGSVVASGIATVRRWLPSPMNPSGLTGYIGSMATLEAWRRQGIGRRVAAHLIDALTDRGVTDIVPHATEAGEDVYRSLGFEPRDGQAELSLRADSG